MDIDKILVLPLADPITLKEPANYSRQKVRESEKAAVHLASAGGNLKPIPLSFILLGWIFNGFFDRNISALPDKIEFLSPASERTKKNRSALISIQDRNETEMAEARNSEKKFETWEEEKKNCWKRGRFRKKGNFRKIFEQFLFYLGF